MPYPLGHGATCTSCSYERTAPADLRHASTTLFVDAVIKTTRFLTKHAQGLCELQLATFGAQSCELQAQSDMPRAWY